MSSPAPAVPPSREFVMLGITYGLYTVGLVMFWPAVVGVIMAYVKRGDVTGTFLDSHYGWLIRTFWWWAAGFIFAVGAIIAMVLPGAIALGRTMPADIVQVPWSVLGGAIGGGRLHHVRLVLGRLPAGARDAAPRGRPRGSLS